MASPRYKVALVHGDLSPLEQGGRRHPQLSAHVLDRLEAHRVVATFRSEGEYGGSRRYDPTGAVEAAERLAAEWNADE